MSKKATMEKATTDNNFRVLNAEEVKAVKDVISSHGLDYCGGSFIWDKKENVKSSS